MRRKDFIDTILNGISDTFDIYHNYWFNNRKFVIYAYNYKNRDKFSTTDSAKLWDMKCFEHLFFINSDSLDEEQLKDYGDLLAKKETEISEISEMIGKITDLQKEIGGR